MQVIFLGTLGKQVELELVEYLTMNQRPKSCTNYHIFSALKPGVMYASWPHQLVGFWRPVCGVVIYIERIS